MQGPAAGRAPTISLRSSISPCPTPPHPRPRRLPSSPRCRADDCLALRFPSAPVAAVGDAASGRGFAPRRSRPTPLTLGGAAQLTASPALWHDESATTHALIVRRFASVCLRSLLRRRDLKAGRYQCGCGTSTWQSSCRVWRPRACASCGAGWSCGWTGRRCRGRVEPLCLRDELGLLRGAGGTAEDRRTPR